MKKAFRTFKAVLTRELLVFSSHRTFSRLSIGLPIFSFVLFIILFQHGVPRDLPVAIYDQDHTPLSRQLIRMIDATPSAMVSYEVTDLAEGERLMKEGKVDAVIYIPRNLEKNVYSNTQANVVAYINGVNITKNGLLNKDIQTVFTSFSSGIQVQTLMKKGLSEEQAYQQMMPIYYEKHILFNPYINYAYYLLPTFLPLMLMLFVLLTTIFTIGIELKNGTARGWLTTADNNILIAIAGKLLPYTLIFFSLALLMDTVLFKYIGVPLRGSVAMIFVSGLAFVLASQSLGVFLVSWLSNMRLSLSIGGGYSVLAFTFSGLTFPFMAMSTPMQLIGYIFPLTFYMEIFIDQAMRGAPVANSTAYLGYIVLFLLPGLAMLPRLQKICTHEKYWGRL